MSGLTTHVLDTMHGRPAAGVALRLLRAGQAIARAVTNADGRCDAPLLTSAIINPSAKIPAPPNMRRTATGPKAANNSAM